MVFMLPFTIKQLEIFYAVAEQLSFTGASHVLHLTQSAISQQINNLEVQCGKPLFEQIGKKIYLTEAGKIFLEHTKNIIEDLKSLKTIILDQGTEIAGTINLCISNGLQHIVFEIISLFHKQNPKVDFQIAVGNSYFILNAINNNTVDFGLMGNSAKNKPNLNCTLITKIPINLIASSQNKLSNKKNILLKELASETFIVGEDISTFHILTNNVIKRLKSPGIKFIKIENQEAIKHAVKANLGISFLPASMVELELESKFLVSISIKDLPPYFYEMAWVQHVNKHISPLTKLFKEFLFKKLKSNINIA